MKGDILQNLHVAIKSVRSCTQDLVKQIEVFVDSRAVVVDRPDNAAALEQARRCIWQLVSVHPEYGQTLQDCGFWYNPESDSYQILRPFTEQVGWKNQLTAALIGLCHFQDFKEQRWLGVGISCRRWFGGLFTGLDYQVQLCQTPGSNASMENLAGHKVGCDPDVR